MASHRLAPNKVNPLDSVKNSRVKVKLEEKENLLATIQQLEIQTAALQQDADSKSAESVRLSSILSARTQQIGGVQQ